MASAHQAGNGVPVIVGRNSASAEKDNVFVYWVSPSGEVQPAPDSRITEAQMHRMREYRKWRRCEARGAREIEKISLIISRQAFEKKKQIRVKQALREMELLKQAQIICKIRKAQNYSQADVEANEALEKKWALRERVALAMIASQFEPDKRTTALEMEVRPQSTSPWARIGQKKAGVCG